MWFILIVAILLSGCSTLQPVLGIKSPELSVADVKLANFDFDGIDLEFEVEIYNPNYFKAVLPAFSYQLNVADHLILEGLRSKSFQIDKYSKTTIKMPVNLEYDSIFKLADELANKKTFEYELLLDMNFDFPLIGEITVPLNYKDELPVITMPEFSVSKCKLSNMTLEGAEIDLELLIKNNNEIEFEMDNFAFNLVVNNKEWASGLAVEKLELKKQDSAKLIIPLVINFMTISKTLLKTFEEGQLLEYEIKGTCDLASSFINDNNSLTIPFDRKGKFKLDKL